MSPAGVIEGGWEFVWAAYGVTAAVLLVYGVTLVLRFRSMRARAGRAREESS
jgi:heme exporter protein D